MEQRERSCSWEDPAELASAAAPRSGIDDLRAIISGELPHPPICATIGLGIAEIDEGIAGAVSRWLRRC